MVLNCFEPQCYCNVVCKYFLYPLSLKTHPLLKLKHSILFLGFRYFGLLRIAAKLYIIAAELTIWQWCNECTNRLLVYRRLLTIGLHGKAAELCLANSWNHRVTTTKYIKYINSIHGSCYSFYHVVLVKFYCDIIARSCLQFINTLIDTSLVNFVPF